MSGHFFCYFCGIGGGGVVVGGLYSLLGCVVGEDDRYPATNSAEA